MKKKLLFAAIAAAMLVTVTACGTGTDVPEAEVNVSAEQDELHTVLDNLSEGQKTGVKDADVPDPPAAEEYLPELWNQYECEQRGVDVDGSTATYLIHVKKDGELFSTLDRYYLVLKYNSDTGEWDEVKSGYYTAQFTVNELKFMVSGGWLIRPEPESDGISIKFNSITSNSCFISWESTDPDVTLNGESSGTGRFTYQTGNINDDTCWVLDGVEIIYKGHKYYIRIQPDEITAPMDDPFSRATGNSVVVAGA